MVAVSIIELRASVATDPDGSIVLNLEGEFDLEAAPLVEDFIESGLATGASRLVLDLGRVSFMDSQAVRALVRAHDTSRVAGAQLVLRSPTKRTMDLLLMTGLDLVFTVEDR